MITAMGGSPRRFPGDFQQELQYLPADHLGGSKRDALVSTNRCLGFPAAADQNALGNTWNQQNHGCTIGVLG